MAAGTLLLLLLSPYDSPPENSPPHPVIPFWPFLAHSTHLQPACLVVLPLQCEQTQDNKGCTTVGVCGKTPQVAGLQDLLIYSLKGLGSWAHLANQNGVPVPQHIQSFITGATFSTLTNGEHK